MRSSTFVRIAFLALALATSPAVAQPTPAEIAAARKTAAEEADKAVEAYSAGRYEEALTGFQKAEQAFHAPKFLLYIARSQIKLGKLLAAKATYTTIINEQLTSYAPPEFFTAQTDAKKELAELSPRIPTLNVQVKGAITAVTLDGQPVALGQAIQVDPGEHTLVGKGAGITDVTKKVTLKESETRSETLEPPPPPAPTVTPTAAPTAPPTVTATAPATTATASTPSAPTAAPTAEGPMRSPPVVTYVAYGASVAGFITGAVLGGLTLAKQGEFDKNPTFETASAGSELALQTDIAFSFAVIAAVAGTVAWLKPPLEDKPKAARRVFVTPTVGGLSISGSF